MVNNKSICVLFYLFLIFISPQARAANIAEWIAAMRAAGTELKVLRDFPLHVVFIQGEKFSNSSDNLAFDIGLFDRMGMFEVVPSRELFWGERMRKGYMRDTSAESSLTTGL